MIKNWETPQQLKSNKISRDFNSSRKTNRKIMKLDFKKCNWRLFNKIPFVLNNTDSNSSVIKKQGQLNWIRYFNRLIISFDHQIYIFNIILLLIFSFSSINTTYIFQKNSVKSRSIFNNFYKNNTINWLSLLYVNKNKCNN